MSVPADLGELLAGATPETWGRAVLAVAAMHEPDDRGRCPFCRPDRAGRVGRWRWWRPVAPCPTRRMLFAEVIAGQCVPPRMPARAQSAASANAGDPLGDVRAPYPPRLCPAPHVEQDRAPAD